MHGGEQERERRRPELRKFFHITEHSGRDIGNEGELFDRSENDGERHIRRTSLGRKDAPQSLRGVHPAADAEKRLRGIDGETACKDTAGRLLDISRAVEPLSGGLLSGGCGCEPDIGLAGAFIHVGSHACLPAKLCL
jgi:hypothetical protein